MRSQAALVAAWAGHLGLTACQRAARCFPSPRSFNTSKRVVDEMVVSLARCTR